MRCLINQSKFTTGILVIVCFGIALLQFSGQRDFPFMSPRRSRVTGIGRPLELNIEPHYKHIYQPSTIEQYIIDNAISLNYNQTEPELCAYGCPIWTQANTTTTEIHTSLTTYRQELNSYTSILADFLKKSPIPDVRRSIGHDKDICSTLELNPMGLPGIFQSSQLSYDSNNGYMEPILPPMRHPNFCLPENARRFLLDINYLIHDFAHLCRKLTPLSKIVLVDMGASLDFHKGGSQVMSLVKVYRQFGMPFDHIYAYEVTPKKPDEVYKLVPDELTSAYHWINVAVEVDPNSKLNPLRMIREQFHKDDLIVVKLDIDTPEVETPLALQILETEELHNLIDVFYFEDHVVIGEMKPNWLSSWGTNNRSIMDSLFLFQELRKKGIASHFWI